MHIYVKSPRSSLLGKEGFFMEMYRATARQRGNSFPSCAWRNILFRIRFSWFDHIFTTNSWKNIFVWFSYHILRQRFLVYTTAGTVSGRFILDISFSTWDFSITLGLTLFSPNLVHPVWRRVCDEIGGISSGSLFFCQFAFFLIVWTSYNDFPFRSACWLPFIYGGVNVTIDLYQKFFRILAASLGAYQPLPEYLRFPHTTLWYSGGILCYL